MNIEVLKIHFKRLLKKPVKDTDIFNNSFKVRKNKVGNRTFLDE